MEDDRRVEDVGEARWREVEVEDGWAGGAESAQARGGSGGMTTSSRLFAVASNVSRRSNEPLGQCGLIH